MKSGVVALIVAMLSPAAIRLDASGPLGIYAIVDSVSLEPSAGPPARMRVTGVFAFVDGGAQRPLWASEVKQGYSLGLSDVKRGYMYFKLPDTADGMAQHAAIRAEWNDIRSVAGTGQVIGFGSWGYIARFSLLQPDRIPQAPSMILERVPRGGSPIDLRVRPEGTNAEPATYQTDNGVVKLSVDGSNGMIVAVLRAGLAR